MGELRMTIRDRWQASIRADIILPAPIDEEHVQRMLELTQFPSADDRAAEPIINGDRSLRWTRAEPFGGKDELSVSNRAIHGDDLAKELLARLTRITSYNVCYTKLLRRKPGCGNRGDSPRQSRLAAALSAHR